MARMSNERAWAFRKPAFGAWVPGGWVADRPCPSPLAIIAGLVGSLADRLVFELVCWWLGDERVGGWWVEAPNTLDR